MPTSVRPASPTSSTRMRGRARHHLVLMQHTIGGLETDRARVLVRIAMVKAGGIDGRRNNDQRAMRLSGPVQGFAFDTYTEDVVRHRLGGQEEEVSAPPYSRRRAASKWGSRDSAGPHIAKETPIA